MREALAGLAVLALGATLVAVMVEPRTPHADEQRALSRWRSPARPSADGVVRFFVIGDWGQGNAGMRDVAAGVARAVASAPGFTFGLTLGDNFYPRGVRSVTDARWERFYEQSYGRLRLPVYATLGNHDWYARDASAQWRYVGASRTWQMPAPRYSFAVGDVQLIALDTTRWSRAQASWLDGELRAAAKRRWVIVYGHHPLYSHGMHGDNRVMIRNLGYLLRGRADFYISGHDHDKQILVRADRPIFVVAGASASVRPVRRGRATRFAQSTLGFAGFELRGDRALVRFYGVDGKVEHESRFAPRVMAAKAARSPRAR
ncbi:MAG: metallophosphoesterase [Myxococcales bacterium]|nr:metallophosphoesterase [Myxococcales bacterium]